MKRRYFFGLEPPPEVARTMHKAWLMQPDAGGRTHHPSDLHMTLVFLGDLEASVETISKRVKPAEIPPFSLELERFAYWSRPKVMVLEPRQCPKPLRMLADSLQSCMIDGEVDVDTRPYKPHVTLARKSGPIEADSLERPISWLVKEYCLFVSDWSGGPPHYRVLSRWPLTGTV